MEKDKKKTLTISSSLKKKIDTSSITTSSKKSFSIDKKKPFRPNKTFNKAQSASNVNLSQENRKKNVARKFIEQQATKDFIKKDNKPAGKSKLKLKGPVDKRDFKLTVSRALNVEEIEIKQRSLASVKRARLKEKKKPEGEEKKEFKKVIREVKIPEQITIQELSNRMAEKSGDIIKFLFNMKVVATINHNIDKDTAEYIVKEFGHVPIVEEIPEKHISKKENLDKSNLKTRPPIVTIMGHVDHGKTSLLDSLRKTNVVSSEHGGITQHIGAYQVNVGDKNKTITFIDTPGHAAFTEMRSRGSKVTDIVVLVIAADDGVKPQTVEAIQHAKAAKVPIIVALNKCDLPGLNIERIKNDLMRYELVAESLGGETLFVEVSAKNKTNLDKLKENILLQSEILDLKARPDGNAEGIVLESKIDKGKGPVSTILVTNGKLKKGDYFICGKTLGKIRALINFEGKMVEESLPSSPVEILGMQESASSGDDFLVVDDEGEAKKINAFRQSGVKEKNILVSDDKKNIFNKNNEKTELNIILKSDVQGSSEALKNAINKIEHSEVKPKIILSDIGMINETDVSLAKASNAVIIGFNMKPNREAKKSAENNEIKINYFNIIYEAIEFVEKSLSGLLEPEKKETVEGMAEILKIFKISKSGKVAGSKVTEGEIKNNSKARIIREGKVIYDGQIVSIFREKNAAKEVKSGLECGISFRNFGDFKEKDIIESYKIDMIQREI